MNASASAGLAAGAAGGAGGGIIIGGGIGIGGGGGGGLVLAPHPASIQSVQTALPAQRLKLDFRSKRVMGSGRNRSHARDQAADKPRQRRHPNDRAGAAQS